MSVVWNILKKKEYSLFKLWVLQLSVSLMFSLRYRFYNCTFFLKYWTSFAIVIIADIRTTVAIFPLPLPTRFIFHSRLDARVFVSVPCIRNFWRKNCCYRIKYNNKDISNQIWCRPSYNFMVSITNWYIHVVSVYLN